MIYYTADWHFGHANIICHCGRPFADSGEMDRTIVANYNAVVTDADTVYILGDVAFKNFNNVIPLLKQMKGTKRLILGNHDKGLRNNSEVRKIFASVHEMLEVRDCGRKVVLCHYPMLSWDGLFRDSVHVYGHVHNSISDPGFELLEDMNAYNAGVDVNNFMPVTLDQLAENKRKFYADIHAGYDPKQPVIGTDFEM